MRRLIDRCAGIDVGQALLVVCVRVVDEKGRLDQQTRSFGATTPDLLDLRDWLAAAAVTHVAMESTGVYWKAPYYLLEDEFSSPITGNALPKQAVHGRVPGPGPLVDRPNWADPNCRCFLVQEHRRSGASRGLCL